jgi:release factor glutamine methyltransferase
MSAETVLALIKKSAAFFEEKGIDEARRSAECLLAHALGQKRLQLFLRFDQPVAEDELARFRDLVRRRLKNEPVQYLVGSTEFYGLEFTVSPAVLIPRPETEHLVEAVIDRCREGNISREENIAREGNMSDDEALPRQGQLPANARILDIGTGSGIIAVTLAAQLSEVQVTAIDISEAALEIARENAVRNNVADRCAILRQDIMSADLDAAGGSDATGSSVPFGGPFDIVVSNPPYIAQQEISTLQPEIREYEPVEALTDGGDGLGFYRRITALLPRLLVPGGLLAVEIGFGQSADVTTIFNNAGLTRIEVIKDYSGIERVVLAWRASG